MATDSIQHFQTHFIDTTYSFPIPKSLFFKALLIMSQYQTRRVDGTPISEVTQSLPVDPYTSPFKVMAKVKFDCHWGLQFILYAYF